MGIFNFFSKKAEKPFTSAVVVAAGSSTRMGGINKILANIGEMPVIAYSLLALQESEYIDEIVIATSQESLIDISDICKDLSLDKVTKVINGGATRQESVFKALCECSQEAVFALIHDGARPLVEPKLIGEVCQKAYDYEAHCATAAVKVKDTIKVVNDGVITETLPRDELYAMQTPQVMDIGLLKGALTYASENKISVTDDCAAVELLKIKPAIVEGSYSNIKITTPEDLDVAEVLLERMNER